MKLWIKLLIGILAGILAAFFLPIGEIGTKYINSFSLFSINLGRYIIFPLVFFSLAISVCKLRRERKLVKTALISITFIVLSTFFLVFIGVIVTLIFSPSRIPLIVETQTILNFTEQINPLPRLFPGNLFKVFTGNRDFLLPLYSLSFIIGIVVYKDREISEPTFNLFDSLSRVFFDINVYITKIMPILLAILSIKITVSIKNISDLSMFKDLILILTISSFIVIFLLYPLILFLMNKKQNPYKTIARAAAPVFTGAVSGDMFFSLSILTRTGKENMNISRKIGAFTFPLCAMFGRAGTALVTSISFLTILKSYSSLEITIYQIFWVILFSILISFALSSIPALGTYSALYILSSIYSQTHSGHTDSFLLIKPIVPILIGYSVMLDILTSVIITVLVNNAVNKFKMKT